MSWTGYFAYDGNEIINVSRTETYVRNAGFHWFRPQFENDVLAPMLGDGPKYRTPLQDDPPWADPDFPEALDFYGFYPLDVSGLEDSSRQSTVVQSLRDGGTPGRLRHSTKEIVFNCLLIAGTEAAAEYGMRWLRSALLGSACGPSSGSACNGAELCYLSSSPEMLQDGGFTSPTAIETTNSTSMETADGGVPSTGFLENYDGGGPSAPGSLDVDGGDPSPFEPTTSTLRTVAVLNPGDVATSCLPPYQRALRRVVFNTGPTITAKRATWCDGGQVWTVTFTAVAGNPWELSVEVPVIEGFGNPGIAYPWAGGVIPEGASADQEGYAYQEVACAVPTYEPIYDPLAPAVVTPPGPPNVPLGYYVPPANWTRRQFTIPKQFVPLWGEVVPKVDITAVNVDLRNLRLRFYADPYEVGSTADDPCAFCGDIVVSYIPMDHTLILDGAEQTVSIISPGGARRRADSLVFKTDGTPFEWPSLTCGFGYIVTVDLPQTQTPPVLDLSLFARSA